MIAVGCLCFYGCVILFSCLCTPFAFSLCIVSCLVAPSYLPFAAPLVAPRSSVSSWTPHQSSASKVTTKCIVTSWGKPVYKVQGNMKILNAFLVNVCSKNEKSWPTFLIEMVPYLDCCLMFCSLFGHLQTLAYIIKKTNDKLYDILRQQYSCTGTKTQLFVTM